MRRILITFVAISMASSIANAQADSSARHGLWATSSTPALKMSETFFNNWAQAGNSQIDLTATFFGNYKYTHPNFVWDNIVDLAYGFAWQDLDNSTVGGRFETKRKSNDKIDLTSAISWKAYKDWGASFTANFKSQFGAGFEYDGIGQTAIATKVSDFMAPAYLTTAISFELKKTDWSVSLSFLTGKTTFVFTDSLIASGRNYGVIQSDQFNRADPSTFNHIYFALGSYAKFLYLKKDIIPNLNLYARAEFFYDYKKPSTMSWGDLSKTKFTGYEIANNEQQKLKDMNWIQRRIFETDIDLELKVDYRLSSYISANFALNLKYDTDFSGIGRWGHLQVYQMAGIQVFFNIKTPKA